MHDFALSVFPEWIDSRRRSNSSQYMVSRRRITSCMITSARASRAARNPAKETQTLIAQPISTPANPMKAGNIYPHSISAAIARRLLIGQAGNADYFLALAIALSLAEMKTRAGMVFIHSPSARVVLALRRAPSDGAEGAAPSGDPGAPNAPRICEPSENC